MTTPAVLANLAADSTPCRGPGTFYVRREKAMIFSGCKSRSASPEPIASLLLRAVQTIDSNRFLTTSPNPSGRVSVQPRFVRPMVRKTQLCIGLERRSNSLTIREPALAPVR